MCRLWERVWWEGGVDTLYAEQKMKFFIKEFFSKCDQILRELRICSHLLKESLMENLIFCAVAIRIAKYLCERLLLATYEFSEFERYGIRALLSLSTFMGSRERSKQRQSSQNSLPHRIHSSWANLRILFLKKPFKLSGFSFISVIWRWSFLSLGKWMLFCDMSF